MEKFTRLTGTACPINQSNVNTDQILPARYLKWTRAQGIGEVLFNDLRRDTNGTEQPDFPLNKPAWRKARMVVSARNFGCGSSREAAIYALYDYGIRWRHIFRKCRAERAADGDRQRRASHGDHGHAGTNAGITDNGRSRTANSRVREQYLQFHDRSGSTHAPAQRLGRHRTNGKLSPPYRIFQGQRPKSAPVGAS
jgi:hypothetical protein